MGYQMEGGMQCDQEPRVLVVDSELETGRLALSMLKSEGVPSIVVRDEETAWNHFRSTHPDLVLSRLLGQGLDGLRLLRLIRRRGATPFIAQAAPFEFSYAIQAVKEGATDAVQIPYCRREFIDRVLGILTQTRSETLLRETLVGSSQCMTSLRSKIVALARVRVPVLLRGESGSGRALVAHALTEMDVSQGMLTLRPGDQMGPVNQLTGKNVYLESVDRHTRPAQEFWRKMLIEWSADDGSGPNRLIASSSQDLGQIADRDEFDRELAELMTRFTVPVPPLRDRLSDIRELVSAIGRQASLRIGTVLDRAFSPGAIAALQRHPWHGNVEQLVDVIEKLMVFSPERLVSKRWVEAILAESSDVRVNRALLDSEQREALVREIRSAGGNLAEVGRRMGMSRGAVIYRAQKYGLMPYRAKRRRVGEDS